MEYSTCIPSWFVTILSILLVGFYQTAFMSWFRNFVNLTRIYEKKSEFENKQIFSVSVAISSWFGCCAHDKEWKVVHIL